MAEAKVKRTVRVCLYMRLNKVLPIFDLRRKRVVMKMGSAQIINVFVEYVPIGRVLEQACVEWSVLTLLRPGINRALRPVDTHPINAKRIVEVVGYEVNTIGKLVVIEVEVVLIENVSVPISE